MFVKFPPLAQLSADKDQNGSLTSFLLSSTKDYTGTARSPNFRLQGDVPDWLAKFTIGCKDGSHVTFRGPFFRINGPIWVPEVARVCKNAAPRQNHNSLVGIMHHPLRRHQAITIPAGRGVLACPCHFGGPNWPVYSEKRSLEIWRLA